MNIINIFASIFFFFIFLVIFCKIYSIFYIKYYDKKNNIKKGIIVPVKFAKTTDLPINSYVIEIIPEEPIVIYT